MRDFISHLWIALFGLITSWSIVPTAVHAAPPFPEFIDPNPSPGNQFGHIVQPLSTGNVVVTSPFDDAGGTDAGAVYLFNGSTGELISTLTGSHSNDNIGQQGVRALPNGNFLIISRNWDNGTTPDAGALTWGNGLTGISGFVSSTNSLVGSSTNDLIILDVVILMNGNYAVRCYNWDNGSNADAGAVTWGSAATGVSGPIGSANSLIGSTASDQVGIGGIVPLSNGNYVVASTNWDNGSLMNVGAATWCSGTSPTTGPITASNSLIGTQQFDIVGTEIVALTNGNYVVVSSGWDNGPVANVGAATWGSGTAGVVGYISTSNSLIGTLANDLVGSGGITALTSGNYVVSSPSWDNTSIVDAGAATWGSGTTGVTGQITSANSLVGTTANDRIGSYDVTMLSNGHYVVVSPNWSQPSLTSVGAVTWCNGATGRTGAVSSSNSLIGTSASDTIGSAGAVPLTNGNYIVASPAWKNATLANAGAATWCSGTSTLSATVTTSNSLVGTTASDNVGTSVVALTNGNFVVLSPSWDNASITDAGAATWGSGTLGIIGPVTSSNSLVGTTTGDFSSAAVTALTNGNYVVRIPNWDNGSVANAGAAAWGNGTTGVTGSVSITNSLVGGTNSDGVGNAVTALTNGHYVVGSSNWDNGAVANVGAATWGNGTAGVTGPVSSSNSLIGTTANDNVGSGFIIVLAYGNYAVRTANWDNGALANAGAITWCRGTVSTSGTISSSNSLIGLVASSGLQPVLADNVNGIFTARFINEGSGKVRLASQIDGLAPNAPNIISPTAAYPTASSNTLGANVLSDRNSAITERGIVFSATATNNNPFINNAGVAKRTAPGTTGIFTVNATSLNPGTTYSFKAYATNNIGTTYTNVGTFTTLSTNAQLASLTVNSGTLTPPFASTTANYSASVPNATTTVLVSATTAHPNAKLQINSSVPVIGGDSSNISLVPGSNNVLIEVISEDASTILNYSLVIFRASPSEPPTLTTPTGTNLTANSALLGGNVTYSGTASITERGIVIAPTATTNNPLLDGAGVTKFTTTGTTGVFTLTATSLTPGTAYSFKAYATSSVDTSYTSPVSTFTTPTAAALFGNWATAAGLTSGGAAHDAIPFSDGVPNLLKYAFNLNGNSSDSRTLVPATGTAGLPVTRITGTPAAPFLRIEFIRRIGSALTYTPQKSATLGSAATWTPFTSSPTVTPINAGWERVIHEDAYVPATTPRHFTRLLVILP